MINIEFAYPVMNSFLSADLLEKADIKKTLIGLACVCFAYSYDNRTTLGDPTVESNWTIAKLCPVFSHLEVSRPYPLLLARLITNV